MTRKPKKLQQGIRQRLVTILVFLVVASFGTYLLVTSHALSNYVTAEANKGNITSPAVPMTDTRASDGNYVQFGSGSIPVVRGRPRIANGTILSDQGTLLRGGTLWIIPDTGGVFDWAVGNNGDNPWPVFGQYRLNTVRLAIQYGPVTSSNPDPITSLTTVENYLDAAVSKASSNHMYAVIDLHYESGGHDQPSAITFWQTIAARYKNNTNVIYELLNEPVGWNPKDYTTQDLADEEQLYKIVHTAAPQTPVMIMTFAVSENDNSNSSPTMTDVVNKLTGIDWSNTVVSFHGYWVNNSVGEQQLKAKYPVIDGEFQTPCQDDPPPVPGYPTRPEDVCQDVSNTDPDYFQQSVMEKAGISWICWNCNHNATSSQPPSSTNGDGQLPLMEQDAKAHGYWWNADK